MSHSDPTQPSRSASSRWYSVEGGHPRYPVRDMEQARLIVAAGAVDGATRAVVTDPEWDGVSHTSSEGDLSAYLGVPG